MPVFSFFRHGIEQYRRKTASGVQNLRELLFSGGIVALVASVIVWFAVFLYVAFYYTYMPTMSHIRPVHLQFRSCEAEKGICSYPSAHVELTNKQQLLMVGQSYKMILNLDMPESPANKDLGMFMVCAELRDKHGTLVERSCRSAMLHYRSTILHVLSSLLFSPMFLLGSREEKQRIVLELFSDFREDQNHPVTDIFVEVQSRHAQVYAATLSVVAHFSGLRYAMFHWPLLSAAVGVTANLCLVLLVCGLSWFHLGRPRPEPGPAAEPDDSSCEDASFMEDNAKVSNSDQGSHTLESDDLVELTRSDSFQLLAKPSSLSS
ncbi:seipin [Bacillus rossius redtenbacheri]|uniref:seipin n=1 Tax=Bacillus rossius redtenbacheri TaxID=93214 RepID=UPI002FDEC681